MNPRSYALFAAVVLTAGCATMPPPYLGIGPYPQLERGRPCPPVDFLGNVLSLPGKLLLWNWKFNVHAVSTQTEALLIDYLEARDLPAIDEARFRLNQYRPFDDLGRLVKNRHVAWPYRLLLGVPVTLVFDVLLPGRLFPWGDYYNPYTNTVHLYSDHPAIALHEAGHVYDFARRRYKGTYAAIRLIPLVDLYQEAQATGETVDYFRTSGNLPEELAAYKILYPAFGTYVGAYIFPPIGTVGGALLGHAAGRAKAKAVLRQLGRPKPSAASLTPLVDTFLETEARRPSLLPAKADEPGDPFNP